jgi:hypothetical protein
MRAAGVLAGLALVIPASASALPSVTTVVAKTGNAGVTFLTDPTGAALTNTETRSVVAIDGYAVGFREDNGVTGGGVLDYSVLPAEYRTPMSAEDKRTYGPAQTDVQPHATCSGVTELSRGSNILAWQPNTGNDPYYNYIPWQKASAGLGDDPRGWISVVRSATGVDLSTLSTAADFRAACERLTGTYHAADTSTPIADALIANALLPLQTQVRTLQGQVTSLTRAKATADTRLADATAARRLAEEAYQALFTRPIDLTLAAKRFAPRNGVALITGSATDLVQVTLQVTKKQKTALGLSSRVLATADAEISTEGAALVTLKPDKAVTKRLEQRKGSIPVTVLAVSGGNQDSTTARLVVSGASRQDSAAARHKH